MTSPASIVDKARTLLTGEPLRAIGYGAVAAVFLATRAYVALGFAPADYIAPALDTIIVAVGLATAAIVEFSRRFVYSPNSVETLLSAVDAFNAARPDRVAVVADGDTE